MTAPGWYPDGAGALRWWDGACWTEHSVAATPSHAPGSASTPPYRLPAHTRGGARGTAFGLLVTEAVLLTGTLPVFGFLVVWGSVWEGSPDVLAKRRTAVHWIMAAGLGNAVAFVLVLLAAGEARRHAPPRWSVWAAGWVLLLGAGWSLALRAQILQGLGFYVLLFTMPPLIALILIHTAARSSKQVPTVAHSDR